jgi:hypothetical protein
MPMRAEDGETEDQYHQRQRDIESQLQSLPAVALHPVSGNPFSERLESIGDSSGQIEDRRDQPAMSSFEGLKAMLQSGIRGRLGSTLPQSGYRRLPPMGALSKAAGYNDIAGAQVGKKLFERLPENGVGREWPPPF